MSDKTSGTASHPLAVFQPSRWGDHFLTLTPPDQGVRLQMEQETRELKEELKLQLLGLSNKPNEQLGLIDAIERLGVAYHFEEEVEKALQQIYEMNHDQCCNDQEDLYLVSLRFRILRQHGFRLSCDVFKRFKEDGGGFKGDLKDILSLYEASHVRTHEDIILDEAIEFTSAYLRCVLKELTSSLAEVVAHALHQPLHKGMTRVEARHHISFYEHESSHNKSLLRLAKLDFNLLQSLHQMELSDVARWWKPLHSKIPYTRDRSVEAYFWALGTYYEPQYSFARRILAKVVLVTQLLDDTYDAYADLQTLDLLNQAINRWEYSCIDQLPEDIRSCYEILLQTFEEFELDLAKEERSFCVHYAKEQMKLNSKAWFQEAKWCHEKYIPSYDEYMEVALESIGHVVGIVGSYLGMGKTATKETFEWICQRPMPKIVRASDIILRLMNDIGGHKFEQSSRNHVPSSIECYMKQYGIKDDQQTYEELEKQVEEAWKDINEAMLRPFEVPKPCLDRLLNLARVPNVMYKERADGYTLVNDTIMHKVASVLVHPIPL